MNRTKIQIGGVVCWFSAQPSCSRIEGEDEDRVVFIEPFGGERISAARGVTNDYINRVLEEMGFVHRFGGSWEGCLDDPFDCWCSTWTPDQILDFMEKVI